MKTHLKQFGKDALIYGAGNVAARAVGFLLLPVYTRIFSPSEYGIIEMMMVLVNALGLVVVMGMDSAQSYYYFQEKGRGAAAQARVVTAVMQWQLCMGTVVVIVGTLASPLLNVFFFGGGLSWKYFALAFAGGLFFQFMNESAQIFRLLYKPWPYLVITLTQTLVSAGVTIALVIIFKSGVLGFLIGFGGGSLIAALAGWWAIRSRLDWSWHGGWWPRLARFGAPLVPAALAMYILNTTDRWFISAYHDQAALGLYAVGAKFAMVMGAIVIPFRLAWMPVAMEALRGENGRELFRTISRAYLGIGVSGVVLLGA